MDLPDKSAPPAIGPPAAARSKTQQVVSGAVLVKRPASRRFKDFLLAESPKVLFARIGKDILIPRAKAGLQEAAESFLSGMLWGDGPRPMSGMVKGTVLRGGAMGYQNISMMQNPMQQAMVANVSRNSGNYQDVLCPSQEIAEHLLANMFALLEQYRMVTVADLYESAGQPTNVSDQSYGWVSLDGARIIKQRDGFLLELPRPSIL